MKKIALKNVNGILKYFTRVFSIEFSKFKDVMMLYYCPIYYVSFICYLISMPFYYMQSNFKHLNINIVKCELLFNNEILKLYFEHWNDK